VEESATELHRKADDIDPDVDLDGTDEADDRVVDVTDRSAVDDDHYLDNDMRTRGH
jgi:hypothetical protein